MLFLPELRAGQGRWWLPISGVGACQLAEGLLASADTVRRDAFQSALQCEPGLALWLVCRAAAALPPHPRQADAAAWLQGHLEVLSWSNAPTPVPDSGGQPSWGLVAQDPLLWGRLAAVTVQEARFEALSPPLLSPLLTTAEQWFSHGAWDETSSFCAAEILPSWLAEWLDGVAPPVVHDAAGRISEPAILQRWTPSADSVAPFLPRLADLVRQGRQDEHDFEARVEQEKLLALRELAYGASHEINNPLANISTRAQTLLRDESDPERRRRLATIAAQAFRAHEMIADMMLFAKPPDLTISEFEMAMLLDTALAEIKEQSASQGTTVDVRLHWQGAIRADRDHLAVAVKALLRNALEALDVGGRVRLTLRQEPEEGGKAGDIVLEVEDTGPGIPPAVRPRLFDPFFSGREAGRGLGLGLSKCWRVVTLHGGTVTADAAPLGGARFSIRLPAELVACPSIPSAG